MKREAILVFLRELGSPQPGPALLIYTWLVAEVELHEAPDGYCRACASLGCGVLDRLHAALGLDAAVAKTGGA